MRMYHKRRTSYERIFLVGADPTHFDQIHSVEDYIKQVPLTEYDTYEPYIERMTQGEKNLITAYPRSLQKKNTTL